MFLQTHTSAANGHLGLSSTITLLWSRWSSKARGRPRDISQTHRVNLDWLFDWFSRFWIQVKKRRHHQPVVLAWKAVTVDTFVQSYDTTHAHQQPVISFLLFFAEMRQDVKASSRIITERATAKQRLVRNLCKYDLKSASSSSSSINPRRNTAGRVPE